MVRAHKWATDPAKFVTDCKPKLLATRRATLSKLRANIRSAAFPLLKAHISGRNLRKTADLASVLESALGDDSHETSPLETICVGAIEEIAGLKTAASDCISEQLLCFVLQEVRSQRPRVRSLTSPRARVPPSTWKRQRTTAKPSTKTRSPTSFLRISNPPPARIGSSSLSSPSNMLPRSLRRRRRPGLSRRTSDQRLRQTAPPFLPPRRCSRTRASCYYTHASSEQNAGSAVEEMSEDEGESVKDADDGSHSDNEDSNKRRKHRKEPLIGGGKRR